MSTNPHQTYNGVADTLYEAFLLICVITKQSFVSLKQPIRRKTPSAFEVTKPRSAHPVPVHCPGPGFVSRGQRHETHDRWGENCAGAEAERTSRTRWVRLLAFFTSCQFPSVSVTSFVEGLKQWDCFVKSKTKPCQSLYALPFLLNLGGPFCEVG